MKKQNKNKKKVWKQTQNKKKSEKGKRQQCNSQKKKARKQTQNKKKNKKQTNKQQQIIHKKKSFFWRDSAPAQRAAGGCSPLKATPGRGPAAGEKKKKETSKRSFFTIC